MSKFYPHRWHNDIVRARRSRGLILPEVDCWHNLYVRSRKRQAIMMPPRPRWVWILSPIPIVGRIARWWWLR